MSQRLQRFPPSSVCLTKPPCEAPSCPPQGGLGGSGLFLLLFSPLFLSPLLPDCLFSRAGPGCLPWVSQCWFPSPDLPLPGQNVYTGGGGSTDLCSCIYRRDRLLCVFFPISAGTCHCLLARGAHFQPNACHFLQLQRDHLQPQQPQRPHFHCGFHHG